MPPLAAVPRPSAPLPVRPPPPQNADAESDGSDPAGNDAASSVERERQQKAIQDLLIAALAVPTNDMAVRAWLRRLGEPITLFGEREMERRDRLRMLMAKLDSKGRLEKLMKPQPDDANVETLQYPFYTEGSKELLDCRVENAKFSILRAASRVQRARRKRDDLDEDIDWALNLKQAGSLQLDCSVFGDARPLSGCSFLNDGNQLATCALTGVGKVWSIPQVNNISALKGHEVRATDIAFSPVHKHIIATASADRTAKLWNADGSLLTTFEGHLDCLSMEK